MGARARALPLCLRSGPAAIARARGCSRPRGACRQPSSHPLLSPRATRTRQFLPHIMLPQAYSRKLKRAIGRQEMDIARRMYAARPTYTLDHLVKERYPRFADALGDCDDALSMLHLFASFPAEPPIRPEVTAMAKRLCREWQYYCARAHALRKVFFTIKGIYYQAEVEGVAVTWLQPWQFSQALPCDVDYKVMLTFLELHEVRARSAPALRALLPLAAFQPSSQARPRTHTHTLFFFAPRCCSSSRCTSSTTAWAWPTRPRCAPTATRAARTSLR
jgi:hypothetical protein